MNPEVIKLIKNTPIGGNELVAMLGNYKSATMKLSSMERAGEVVRLKRGLYVVDICLKSVTNRRTPILYIIRYNQKSWIRCYADK